MDLGLLQHLLIEIFAARVNSFKYISIAIKGLHLTCFRGLIPNHLLI